ncbi:amino acid adenylation domain-containing protein [Clostridium beijerinckii]|uniref:amino acid adenylation domain-containing protein n=1 Tax=Clostridium beijerinckii TaxID=1520 RepID=UPI000A1C7807|nr:amino acid adenylation domain-containing protein [Clostridium beijerinckii]CUU48777.1 Bacitracin synthetase 1 [Clostridium beijerinckii]
MRKEKINGDNQCAEENDSSCIVTEFKIGKKEWVKIRQNAYKKNIEPLAVILTSIGEVFGRWGDGTNLMITLNSNLYKGFRADFESGKEIFLNYNCSLGESFSNTCIKVQEELENLIRKEQDAVNLNLNETDENMDNKNQKINIISCNDYMEEESLRIKVNLCEEFHLEGVIDTIISVYECFANWIAETKWDSEIPELMPESQRKLRDSVNNTEVSIEKKLLHEDFFINAKKYPERQAVLWTENGIIKSISYGELTDKSLKLARLLINRGIKEGDIVSITQSRGISQIISILGILAVGAAYVPVGVKQPKERRDKIYKSGGIKYVITNKRDKERVFFSDEIETILIEDSKDLKPLDEYISVNTNSLAYIIFTSGSTGAPKGVEIMHESAYNTILDINKRFSVTDKDRILAVSALDFDLSVYDIFGLLSAGGGIVLLDEKEEREALIWNELIYNLNITVWNSVPALLDMLLMANHNNKLLSSLRLVLVSGDWIGLDIYPRLLEKAGKCRFIALGGATEASIWSNYYEVDHVDSNWTSIPYGKPLSNQSFRVVDKLGRDCLDMVSGELLIGGMGVARGYVGNKELTSKSFIEIENKRWYRTGDFGRYRSDGIIEFMGRADQQVKLRGFRIELGEIEEVLKKYKGVNKAVALIASNSGLKHLAAAIEPEVVSGAEYSDFKAKDQKIEDYRKDNVEMQSEMVEALLIEILNLNSLQNSSMNEDRIIRKLSIDNEFQYLLEVWLSWLVKREVIKCHDGNIDGGLKLSKALAYLENMKKSTINNEDSLIIEIGKYVLEKIDDYRKILKGEKPVISILEDNIISPENISARDLDRINGIQIIADKIKKISSALKKPVEVALLGGRSGVLGKMLLDKLKPEDIKLTYLDSASSMIKSAKKIMNSKEHFIEFCLLKEDQVPDKLCYSFDLVLAFNSLHRYYNAYRGILIGAMLLKNGGKIFALENSELTPIALLTASVLEKGFKDFDDDRKASDNPMLTADKWGSLLAKAGFENINYESIKDSFTEFIEADFQNDRFILKEENLLNFMKANLPEYMIPEKIDILPIIPLTSNGKVDRKAIEKILLSSSERNDIDEVHDGTEKEIEEMWKRIIEVDFIGRNQGFFEIGGDSLLATRFISEVKERFGINLSLREMFEKPLLYEIAERIEENLEEGNQDVCLMEEGEI